MKFNTSLSLCSKSALSLVFLLGIAFCSYAQITPVVANASICSGTTARLAVTNNATGSNYFRWYKNANLTGLLQSGIYFETPVLTATTSYYVVEATNAGVNGTNVKTVTVTVNPLPAPPVVAASSVCEGKPAILTTSATSVGGIINWSSDAAGSINIGTGTSLTSAPITQATTFYAREVSGAGCVSSISSGLVGVYALPATPAVANASICAGSAAVLTAIPGSATTQWFSNAAGTISAGMNGSSLTTPSLSSPTSYWAANISNRGCLSPLTRAVVNTRAVPSAATIVANPVCAGKPALLFASGLGVAEWHKDALANPIIATGGTYTTPPLASTTTYYVVLNNQGCRGTDVAVTATVNGIPAAPTVSNATTCVGKSAKFDASANPGSIIWYSDPAGVNALSTAAIFNTIGLQQNENYYVAQKVNGCMSPLKQVTATAYPLPATPLITSSPTICAGNTAVLTADNLTASTTWYSSLAATQSDSVGTGSRFVTPALSTNTSYFVQVVNNTTGCKSGFAAANVNVNRLPTAYAGGDVAIRYGETYQFKASGGVNYKWSNPSTLDNPYVFNPTTSAQNTTVYFVTVTDEKGCSASDNLTLTVNPDPVYGSVVNVITPNGDGVNDTWELPFLYKITSNYVLKIYARAGNEVFTTSNYEQNWNGKMDGVDLPEGSYWYILTVEGAKTDYRGAITIKR